MADPRPYVINANVIKLLGNAPVQNMRPNLGSLVQRQTIDIGCYPFPFMVNSDNIPLDGRTSDGKRLEIRPVPYWCSENTYAKKPGDTTYNNGRIVWANKKGFLQSFEEGNNINLPAYYAYDSNLGVTYSLLRVNTAFVGMDNTVPREWVDLRDLVLGTPDGLGTSFAEGSTLEIAKNLLFKIWSGLSLGGISGNAFEGITYGFFRMENYIQNGGTFSPFLDRYNYGCLDQIFNSDRFANVGINPDEFWDGAGVSYGISGGITGELFLLNSLTGGENSGTLYVESPGIFNDPLIQTYILKGVSGGNTLSGKQLALNLYGVGSETPYLAYEDGVNSFVDTMALLLATNQKFATLRNGQTASLRSLDYNNPCSASFVYREDTDLGRWGYQVQRLPIGEDQFEKAPAPLIGCNINTFLDYVNGLTAKANGVVHPMSWMFWKGLSSGGQISKYAEGFVHDYVGLDDANQPVYNKLEGIHDHLCYEYYDNTGLKSRVYYPLRPITGNYYSSKVSGLYNTSLEGASDALAFGNTIDKKYDTGFPDEFKGVGSVAVVEGAISLRNLDEAISGITIEFTNVNELNGVTGVLFPYFIPLASFAMQGVQDANPPGSGDLVISGEFDNFSSSSWNKAKFNVEGVSDSGLLYQYYADGVSSAAPMDNQSSSPYYVFTDDKPNFRLFSWNALTKISPLEYPHDENSEIVKSSFQNRGSDSLGAAYYTSGNKLEMDGSNVDVDVTNYPPAALPSVDYRGLTYKVLEGDNMVSVGLDCGSYINAIRYANNTNPNESPSPNAFGLTATRKLIANVTLGASEKSFSVFDPDKTIQETNISNNFGRQGNIANTSSNFFDSRNNFFFTTSSSGDPLSVFNGSYYLTASQYFNKYVNTGSTPTWWENIDIQGLALATNFIASPSDDGAEAIASDITLKLVFAPDWSFQSQFGLRSSPYEVTDTQSSPNGLDVIPGVYQALKDGLHPAFVYRIFASNVLQNLGSIVEGSCIQTWRSSGIRCDKLSGVINGLRNTSHYGSYFSGNTGCGSVGNEFDPIDFDQQKGKDFFGRYAIVNNDGILDYAFADYYYSPIPSIPSNSFFTFQNQSCSSGEQISDPPTSAELSAFGLQFAEAIRIVDEKPSDFDFTDAKKVREELFAFRGNTASLNGTNNDMGITLVSDWMQSKLKKIFDYWNTNRSSNSDDLAKIEIVLSTLYPTEFPEYKNTFVNSSTYKLWAIKPKCVEEWTPECSELASSLYGQNTYRFAAFPTRDALFRDEEYNSGIPSNDRTIRPSVSQLRTPIGNNTTVLTSGDIVPENEGFIGAFRTLYIEPLGLATRVLATEAQAVPRATISSTVLGKITTIIDSNGFLKDVNQITFESGFGMKILGDNTTGNISFSVAGLTLGSLDDVSIVGASGGDILVYDAELAKWINRPFGDVVQPFLAGFTGGGGGTNFFYQDSAPDAGITIGSRWMNSDTGIEYIYINDGDSFQWIQSSVDVTAETPTFTYNTTLVTGSEYAALDTDYYIGVSYAGEALIQLPSDPSEGKTVIVKDASGMASYGNRKITVVGADAADTIDNEESAIINVNNGALQFIYKNGWRII